MDYQTEWAKATELANRAGYALDEARYSLGALGPGDDGINYTRNLEQAGREVAQALKLAQEAADAYLRSDELYEAEYA